MSGEKCCPFCGTHVYRTTHGGDPAYKCASPPSGCELNELWGEEHGLDMSHARAPLGRSVAQVRRANAELPR